MTDKKTRIAQIRPRPTSIEKKLSDKDILVSKTDTNGIITYGNDVFVRVSGYKEVELINSPHNILRHPDMPAAVFKLMWDTIESGENITAVVKNMNKQGDYYWVITDFEIKKDKDGKIESYTAYRRKPVQKVIDTIEPIYKKMLEIEEIHGMGASFNHLTSMLEEKKTTYNDFIAELTKAKGISEILFNQMKKLFK